MGTQERRESDSSGFAELPEENGNKSDETTRPISVDKDDKAEKSFEEMILKKVGEFGFFQIRLFAILTLMDIPTSSCMSLFIFATANPGWHCGGFAGSNETYNGTLRNSTEKMCSSNGSSCTQYVYNPDYASIATDWDLVCDSAYIPKLTVSIQMVGVLVGALLCGQLADTFGRKKTLLIAATTMFVTQSVLGLSNSWQLYTVLSFLKGLFMAGSISICYTMPMEFIGTRYRTLVGSLGIWGFGAMIMALIAWQTKNWRWISLISGLIGLPLVVGVIFFVPESIRWLVQKGRFEEAEKIIREMARVNKKEVPDMSVLKVMAEEAAKRSKLEGQYSYHDLFRTMEMGKRAAVIMLTWFTASLFVYGISNMYDTFSGTIHVNLSISSVVSMIFAWSIIPSADRFGRRKTFFAYIMIPIVCLTTVVIVGALGLKYKVPDLITALILIGKGGIISVWCIAAICASELFPTLMRNIAMGSCSMAARLGGILAPQVALLGLAIHWTVPYIIIGILSLLCAVLFLCVLPETNRMPLEEEIPPRRKRRAKKTENEENDIELTQPLNRGDEPLSSNGGACKSY